MSAIIRCPSCRSATPSSIDCVHCGAPLRNQRSLITGALAFVGASLGAMTLMACYGQPPCDDSDRSPLPDGGTTSRCDYSPCREAALADGGTATVCDYAVDAGTDGGVKGDGGTQGDAGVDAGP